MNSNNTNALALPEILVSSSGLPLPSTDFRRPIRVGMSVIALALGGFGVWAACAPLDSAVIAQGVVAVESKRKAVQHREGGIVAQVLVTEGQRVEAGAVLARLKDAGAQASMVALTAERDAKLAEEARLLAERDGRAAIAFPPGLLDRAHDPRVAEILRREADRFQERAKSLSGQLGILQSRVAQLEASRHGRAQLGDTTRRQIALMQEELAGLRGLEAKGYYPRNKLRAEERDLARLQGELYSERAGTAELDKQIGEAKLQAMQTRQKFQEEVATDLSRTEVELNDVGQKLVAARDEVERLAVVAPVAGVVQGLKIAGPGAVVPPGGEVAEIVPDNDRLVVESQINPRDIDRVHDGQPARLRFPAFNARVTPVIEGKVEVVSADRFTDPATRQGYYAARVEVPADQAARLPGSLKAGMPVEVMIEGGARTPLQYFLKPLDDSFARGFKER